MLIDIDSCEMQGQKQHIWPVYYVAILLLISHHLIPPINI